MSYMPWFPEPGSYVKYYDVEAEAYKYLRLMWCRKPYIYPFRLPQVAADTKGDTITFDEINPSQDKKHRYLTYIGVKPSFLFYLWHPYDIKSLKWDEKIEDIDEDLVACLSYEESPYEFPTKHIALEHDRYPALQAKNVSGETKTPEIIWVGALYKVKEHEDLSPDEIAKLESGALRSYPWDFGGEL